MKEVNQNTPARELDRIREGDQIKVYRGKTGEVERVQIVCSKGQRQYFYKLKNDGSVFIIR